MISTLQKIGALPPLCQVSVTQSVSQQGMKSSIRLAAVNILLPRMQQACAFYTSIVPRGRGGH